MNALQTFPRSHLALAALVALPLTPFLFASPSAPSNDHLSADLALEHTLVAPLPLPASVLGGPELPIERGLNENRQTVRAGDSLARLFDRAGVPSRDLAAVMDAGPAAAGLKRIFPGRELVFLLDREGRLARMKYLSSPFETVVFDRVGDRFEGQVVTREPQRVATVREGTIDKSLFAAGQNAGLDDDLTMRLAQIFQSDVDFVLDIRRGDSFKVLFDELYIDDRFVGFGDILAAEFHNAGNTFRAVRFVDADGNASFYNPNGESMRKAFLRAPLDFRRVSSEFNLQRMHPLYNRMMPHRGIDYAAPIGTPVYASGDGRVQIAARTEPNGNYIVIQHGEQFQTKYLHLSRFANGLKSGKRVHQGELIGYVGQTGWATGPHLHYEFLVNGVHQNPRTVDLPTAQPVAKSDRAAFTAQAGPLLALLSAGVEDTQVATTR